MLRFLRKLFGSSDTALIVSADAPSTPESLQLVGHGLALTPLLPRGVFQTAEGVLIFGPLNVELAARDGVKNAAVLPGTPPSGELSLSGRSFGSGEEGSTALKLGEEVEHVEALFTSVVRGAEGPWRIVTQQYSVPFPPALTMRVGETDGRGAVWDLSVGGSAEDLILLHGPLKGASEIPVPDQLMGPGMRLGDQGVMDGVVNSVVWVEFHYERDGERWRQRIHYVPVDSESVYLIRAQARESFAPAAFGAAALMVSSFTPKR